MEDTMDAYDVFADAASTNALKVVLQREPSELPAQATPALAAVGG
jgi:hypothetical protein